MMTHLLLILPVAIPLLTLACCLMFLKHLVVQRYISLAGSIALLVSAIALFCSVFDGTVQATHFGSWQAPFGIVFVADMFAGVMVLVTGVMAVAVSVYALGFGSQQREQAMYYPLYNGLLMGVMGAFLTGDIFNLYVWFEVMLTSSFGLLVIGGTRRQYDAGVKYVTLNLFAATLFLMSVGFLYGLTGTLNMADLALAVPKIPNQGLVATISMLLLVAFGLKAAVFPLFFWLPAAYPTTSIPVAAIFAALLTKVGVYVIFRVFTLVFPGEIAYSSAVIGVMAGLTMIVGVLGAASHYDIRKILSFHIISQIGYMLLGLAIATPMAIAGSIFYIVHHIVVKANLFLLAGVIRLAGGSFDLRQIGGLYRTSGLLSFLFVIPALSLAGMPPLSGFWAKLIVIQAALENRHYLLATVGLCVGLITLYSMLKIWNEAFWKKSTKLSDVAAVDWQQTPVAHKALLLGPIVSLAAITVCFGLGAEVLVEFSMRAAEQMVNPQSYIQAAMGTATVEAPILELSPPGSLP